jgi:hypothetical protein
MREDWAQQSFGERNFLVHSQPIVVETVKLLDLPPVCACCGQPTKRVFAVKPSDPTKRKETFTLNFLGLIFPPLTFVSATILFSTPNAKLPLCRKCRFDYFLPDRKVIIFILTMLLCFICAFYYGFRQEYGFMLTYLFFAMVCLVLLIRKNRPHQIKTLPVQVYELNGRYRYVIYGGPLYDHFSKK